MDPGSIYARLVAASIWSALVAGMLYTSVTGEAATVQYLKALVAKEAVDCGPHHRLPIVVAAARFLLTSSQLRVKLLELGAPDPTCALASCDVQCPVSAAERLARLQYQIVMRALSLADRQCSVKGSS